MAEPMDVEKGNNEVDETLYSRQLYVMGHEAQKRMAGSDVLICGLNGLGVEIAKNVILAGVKSVSLHDPRPTSWEDLSAQFYLSEADLGKPRASACVGRLAELNRYVQVGALEGEPGPELLGRFQVVVAVDTSLAAQLEMSNYCHANGICFIGADVRGVFASVFCDFGPSFIVSDKDGNPASSCLISSITRDKPALVTVMDDQRHNLVDGDVVIFSSMDGMTELEGREYTIKERSPFSFEIDADTTGFGTFVRGYVNQVKKPVTYAFKPLRQALEDPGEFLETDFAKIGRPGVLHQAFRALHAFREQAGGELPRPGSTQDAETLFNLTAKVNEGPFKVDGLEESKGVVQKLALSSRGVINPMCASLGGIVGQEVLKACSGKFSPIRQWLYYDAAEALPDDPLPAEEVAPRGCRYDGQIMVFGNSMQAKLADVNLFLVGAGAIGCEMLKNWAMMGVGCGGSGVIHVTDMDRIEKSNLSRQFLFRELDIGQFKSHVAAAKAKEINPALKVKAYELKCAPDTEEVFNDDYYESLWGVCTALDNVEARLYMDQRCLFYKKPMFESGTLGTKGNTQVVVPFLTENYGASRDPPEKSIPVCTLKNFPNQIEHTLQWARDWFEGVFKQNPEDVNQYLENPDFQQLLNAQHNTKLDTLRRIEDALGPGRPKTLEDCVEWARLSFESMFHNAIAQLLHNFPLDSVTASGTPFWSGAKRPPQPLVFDDQDPTHLEFVKSVANLRAENYGIPGSNDDGVIRRSLAKVVVPPFKPYSEKIATTDQEAKEQESAPPAAPVDVDVQCQQIMAGLPTPAKLKGFRLQATEFDKDLDSHMAVITSASNLRASNYKIPTADMHRSRLIAGKIIPAIATTTALVTGLVCVELYKVLQQKPLESYKNWFLNLALPQFACSEPIPPAKTKALVKGKEWNWSAWDCIDIKEGNITLEKLFKMLETEYGLEVTMLSHGVAILFSFFAQKKKMQERMAMTMTQVVEHVTKHRVPDKQKYLIFEICVQDIDTAEEVDVPYLRYHIR